MRVALGDLVAHHLNGRATQTSAGALTSMIRIAISPAAYAVIASALPGSNVRVDPQRAPNGDYRVWLDRAVVDRLAAMRRPLETYSDIILRLAKGAS